MILTRFGCEDCSRLIRSHSGSRFGVLSLLRLPSWLQAESLSASRVRVVPRRPFWAVPFNEKEFFYRSRVLRRARKQAASADWTGRCPVLVSSEEVAALANRCQQLEWAGAVAHYNVTQRHERVSLLEAAGEMPLLPFPVASPEAQPVGHTAQVTSAPASPASADDARREEAVEPEAARLVDPL